MFFYFVKSGDTLSQIAKEYHTSVAKLMEDNDIDNKNNLTVGQVLLIKLDPMIYNVKKGDTLSQIANDYHVSVDQIKKWNNKSNDLLSIGERLNINYSNEHKDKIKVNGYCYEGINIDVLKKTLKYLTYLSVFAYKVNQNGELNNINDERIISLAIDNNVAPIMVVTNIKEKGGFSSNIASSILNDDAKIDNLFNNILNVLKQKNYYGLNIDFEYVYEKDKNVFENFLKKAYKFFTNYGYMLTTALAPKTSEEQKGLLYEAHNYKVAGMYNDLVILMTYEWGYTYGDSMPVSPLNRVENVIKYAISEIPNEKILMGVPNYGYDFLVPKEKQKPAKSISLKFANNMAFDKKSEIKYYQEYQTPYYVYYEDNKKHEVQFDNAYSFYKKLELVDKYSLGGISIWTITTYNTPYYLLLSNLFFIDKVLK